MRTIFTNCKILTMNVAQPEATALVVEENKILFVGNDADALSFKQSDSNIIDGQGTSLLPGFNDSHMH
ncbi:MAG: amidohydrolase, partial [Bacillota bacterium]|nr:amidohydrolase [Bacillota bacterium]